MCAISAQGKASTYRGQHKKTQIHVSAPSGGIMTRGPDSGATESDQVFLDRALTVTGDDVNFKWN
jgi:hypothetical protein